MIRKAVESDVESLCSIDTIARVDPSRHDYIRRRVREGRCYVLTIPDESPDNERIVGYGVLTYEFYECGMIEMLMVDPNFRRDRFGSALVRHMETECRTAKLFTSTNESNAPMLGLLTSLGYQPSGIIQNLDAGDPELVYFKQLR